MNIVISQPMFFPWVGFFEQIRLADRFVHYDDVQMPQGRSFMSRVQIKTLDGTKWLTVPIKRAGKQLIKDVEIDHSRKWKRSHIGILKQSYKNTKHGSCVMSLVDGVYNYNTDSLAEFCISGIEHVSEYLGIECEFSRSSNYGFTSISSDKLIDIVELLNGDVYITGHGAKNYLDHEKFESNNIDVEYMKYEYAKYKQMNGDFTPYVSILDLIANMGVNASKYIVSGTTNWKEFICE